MDGNLDILQIILESGLVVKSVLVLLIICSILSISIAWKKFNEFKNFSGLNNLFMQRFDQISNLEDLVQSGKEIQEEVSNGREYGPFEEVFLAYTKEINKINSLKPEGDIRSSLSDYKSKNGFDFLNRSFEQGLNRSNEKMNNNLSTLATIGSITPFIGLFGTVWGIIDSFTGLAQGGASLDAVAPGIAEALVATAVGLFAAIPAVWFYNTFSNRIGIINGHVDDFGKEFINFVEKHLN